MSLKVDHYDRLVSNRGFQELHGFAYAVNINSNNYRVFDELTGAYYPHYILDDARMINTVLKKGARRIAKNVLVVCFKDMHEIVDALYDQ